MRIDKNRALVDLSESPRSQFGKTDYGRQSVAQKVFSSIWELESQVNNGGFQQYFYNATGEAAGDVVAALKTIGADKTAKIVENALAIFPGGRPPANLDIRRARLTTASADVLDRWNQLGREFFAYPDNLTNLLYDFVKGCPTEFGEIQ